MSSILGWKQLKSSRCMKSYSLFSLPENQVVKLHMGGFLSEFCAWRSWWEMESSTEIDVCTQTPPPFHYFLRVSQSLSQPHFPLLQWHNEAPGVMLLVIGMLYYISMNKWNTQSLFTYPPLQVPPSVSLSFQTEESTRWATLVFFLHFSCRQNTFHRWISFLELL